MSNHPQQTKGKKKLGLNAIISFGASVVILGLMFKILHWKGAEIMIAVGLITEAALFAILGYAAMDTPADATTPGADGKKADDLNDLLSTAITPAVIQKLSKGFEQFNKTVDSVHAVVNTVASTANMTKEIESATADLKKFRDHVNGVGANFDAFSKTLQSVNSMSVASSSLLKDFEAASAGMKSYTKNMADMNTSFDTFNKTLSAINQMTVSSQNMLKEFEAATQGMKAYNKNVTDLSKIYAAQLEAFRKI